jgi:hypothetical protein
MSGTLREGGCEERGETLREGGCEERGESVQGAYDLQQLMFH